MIERDVAALVVIGGEVGSDATAAGVSAHLGVAPTRSAEAGTATRNGWIRRRAFWNLEVELAPGDDRTGTASLRALLERMQPLGDRVRELDGRYEVRISWGAFSDSSQGGFVLEADVATALGRLGLPLYGDVHLDDSTEPPHLHEPPARAV